MSLGAPLSKLHFVALVSVDFDADMLPYFIPHYSDLECDNYCLFLHEGKDVDATLWAQKAALEAGWKCRIVPREASFGNGELKRALLEKFQRAAKPNDYIMCADGDEFQVWKKSPREYMQEGFDMLLGQRIDRFNVLLFPVDHALELEENFPEANANLSKLIYPRHPRARDKIVMSKALVPVDYKKCFGLSVKAPSNLKASGDIPILHYKWRSNIFDRLRQRPDYTPEEVAAIKKFFQ